MDDVFKLGFLGDLQRMGIHPGLERMRAVMEAFGNPQLDYPVVLITGTNGKGSVTCFTESILRSAGYRTGRFTSPHLVDVKERIFIDGAMIGAGEFAEIGGQLSALMSRRGLQVTFFEALTAMGFVAFKRAGVDVAVVEIGMGGRLDSTNVAEPAVSVLTNVGIDHTGFLGSSKAAIAREKVGIARKGRPLVTGCHDDLLELVVVPEVQAIGGRVIASGRDFLYSEDVEGLEWRGWNRVVPGLSSGLAGKYQADNLSLAVAAVSSLQDEGICRVSDDAIRNGAARAVWPGRFQKVSEHPTLILDGCHNVHAAERLAAELPGLSRPLVIVHASKAEKDWVGVLERLVPYADAIIETGFPGGVAPEELAVRSADFAKPGVVSEVILDCGEAVSRAKKIAGSEGTVLVTGSLYMIGALMKDMGDGA